MISLLISSQALAMMPYDDYEYCLEDEEYCYDDYYYTPETLEVSATIDFTSTSESMQNFKHLYNFVLDSSSNQNYNSKELEIFQAFKNMIDNKQVSIFFSSEGDFALKTTASNNEFETLLNTIKKHTFVRPGYIEGFNKILFKNGEFALIDGNFYYVNSYWFDRNDVLSINFPKLNQNDLAAISTKTIVEEKETTSAINISENPKGGLNIHSLSDIDFEVKNSSLKLGQVLPASDPLLYVEFSNFKNLTKSALGLEIEELLYAFDIKLDNLELLNENIALLIDNNNTNIPTITFALNNIDTNTARYLTESILNLVPENISISNVNSDLVKLTIVEDDINQTVYFGKLNQHYVITNNTNIISELGNPAKSLLKNIDFANSLAFNNNSISVSYISFQSIQKYIENNFTNVLEELNTDEVLDILNKMGIWSGYSSVENKIIKGKSEMTIPFKELTQLLKNNRALSNYQPYYWNPFQDVEEGQWYYEPVTKAYSLGIISEYDAETNTWIDTFQPAKEISRGEFTSMIVRAYPVYQLEAVAAEKEFIDLDESNPYYFDIMQAYYAGVIKGDDNANTFRPNDTLSRAEAVQILNNISPLLQLTNYQTEQIKFDDVKASDWFAEAVTRASNNNIVQGVNPTTFAPEMQLNKAQAVTLIIRLLDQEVTFQ